MLRWSPHWTVIDEFLSFEETTTPPTPPANQVRLYAKDSGGVAKLFYEDDAGTEIGPLGAGTVTGTGSANKLAIWSAASVLTFDANLHWDTTNDRLGIGTATPDSGLHIQKAGGTSVSAGGASLARFEGTSSFAGISVGSIAGQNTFLELLEATTKKGHLQWDSGATKIELGSVGSLAFQIGGSFSERLLLDSSGHLTLGGGATASELRLLEPSGSGTNYTSFKSPALAANVNYTLPPDDGDAGEVLSTDGAGVLTWIAGGSGHTIRENGTDQTARTGLNFIDALAGAGLITDDAGGNETEVNLDLYILASGARAMAAALDLGGFDLLNVEDLSMDSDGVARMESQNRFRHLNSMVEAREGDAVGTNDSTWTLNAYNDADAFDTDALHDTVTNNSRLTAQIAGKYLCWSYNIWAANVTGERNLRIEKNSGGVVTGGTFVIGHAIPAVAGTLTQVVVAAVADLAVGDYIESFRWQNSGGNLNWSGTAGNPCTFGMAYIGESV